LNPAPWEEDDAREEQVATVVFSRGPQEPFDYLVPNRLRGEISPGQRVRAPLGKSDRLLTGYCVRVHSAQSSGRLKPIESAVDPRPLLDPAMLRLTEWMA